MIHMIFLTTGLIVGLLSGIFGIGGGIIVFPIVYFCLNKLLLLGDSLSLAAAAATSLMITIPTLTVSVIAHQKNGDIKWKMIQAMLPGIIIGVLIATVWLVPIFNPHTIKAIFAISSWLIALQIFYHKPPLNPEPVMPSWWLSNLAGFIIGSTSSLLGIAGGEYSASFLSYHQFKIKQVTASTAVIGLVISLLGSIGFLISAIGSATTLPISYSVGYVYIPAVIQICLTSLILASIGAKLSTKMKSAAMHKYFAFLIAGAGILMLCT
ncbi:MAG: sulfite exporter TauE/SafE family protein [Burkholderiales bacterium]